MIVNYDESLPVHRVFVLRGLGVPQPEYQDFLVKFRGLQLRARIFLLAER